MAVGAKAKVPTFRQEVISKVTILIISAFGLIAALAWNSAIQTAVTQFLGTSSQLGGLVAYAIIVTVLAVIVTIYLSRLARFQK